LGDLSITKKDVVTSSEYPLPSPSPSVGNLGKRFKGGIKLLTHIGKKSSQEPTLGSPIHYDTSPTGSMMGTAQKAQLMMKNRPQSVLRALGHSNGSGLGLSPHNSSHRKSFTGNSMIRPSIMSVNQSRNSNCTDNEDGDSLSDIGSQSFNPTDDIDSLMQQEQPEVEY
jgi:hypothetical protein